MPGQRGVNLAAVKRGGTCRKNGETSHCDHDWETHAESGLGMMIHPPDSARFLGTKWAHSVRPYPCGCECTANIAPCGSMPCATQLPPGTSIGPLMIVAPLAFATSAVALASFTET
jgi:hypothetical protein